MQKVSNEELLRRIEYRMMGDKMTHSPDYAKVKEFYDEILKNAPKHNWAYDESLEVKLRLVIEEINRAESKTIGIYLSHGQYEQLVSSIQTLEYDMAAQANSLTGGDVSWDCYDRDNWINSYMFCHKIANILGVKIDDSLEKEEIEEENFDDVNDNEGRN